MVVIVHFAINGFPVPGAVPYKVGNSESGKWYRALDVNGVKWCVQPRGTELTWGFKFLGAIQGFDRCRKCSRKEWYTLPFAPNPYE